jgi:nitrate/TMAO reductase-like tetraheme cytochrome c subunit
MSRFSFRRKRPADAEPAPHQTAQAPRRRRLPVMQIDLNRPEHRRRVGMAFLVLVLISAGILLAGVKTYEYTESAEFCGQTCHVMTPEFVRFEESPHANVECAKCHIGPGASFFVKSKIDGLKQVYAVLTDSFSRPIKSPVHNLRPARETCEECHSPTMFKDNIIKIIRHYDNDEQNTPIQSTFILKMGGWEDGGGVNEGIHWHISNPVYYIPADDQRQVILWVGMQQEDGTLKEFYLRDMLNMAWESFVEEARKEGKMREMDCIDCHNRAAHFIPPPEQLVDASIDKGRLPRDLPYIRAKAVTILSENYTTQEEAFAAIDALADYYLRTNRPAAADNVNLNASFENVQAYERKVQAAMDEIKRLYTETHFSELGMNWQTNPNNARHHPFPGCFRCHDDKHVTVDKSGNEIESISVKCNLCHTVPIVGRGDDMLVEAPVIVGAVPVTHSDFRWTIEHRNVKDAQAEGCFDCHGQRFCNNGACHNLSHPPDMLYSHAEEYKKQGGQVCYTCHQDVLCSRCHPGGIITNP